MAESLSSYDVGCLSLNLLYHLMAVVHLAFIRGRYNSLRTVLPTNNFLNQLESDTA